MPVRATAALVAASSLVSSPLADPAPPESPDGLYLAGGAARFWIGPFPELGESRYFLDLVTLRFGPLAESPGGGFVAGPSFVAKEPVDLVVTPAAGGLKLTYADGSGATVERRPRRVEEVAFENGAVNLAGTVTLPEGEGPHGAVVLIHGSGPLDRRWFQLWADLFAGAGLVALTYDKRGTGSSGGDWKSSGLDDLTGDAVAATELLARRSDVDPARIGVWGISQGGWIAPLVAERWPRLAFVVLHAGPAMTVFDQGLANFDWELRAAGLDAQDVEGALGVVRASLEYNRRPSDAAWAVYERAHAAETARGAPWVPPFEPRDAWFRAFYGKLLDFDPKPHLERLRRPVLAFFGELDANVPPASNLARLEAALATAGNRDATIVLLPKANHLFLAAENGTSAEYPTLSRFVPGYFDVMSRWLRERFGSGRAPSGSD